MTAIYLWSNSILYLFFSVLCTLKLDKTSYSLGFESLSNSGRSEYLTVYGGMELGFAAFFAYLAAKVEYRNLGLLFSIFLYGGIVIFRTASFFMFSPLSNVATGTAFLEVFLLVTAVILYRRSA